MSRCGTPHLTLFSPFPPPRRSVHNTSNVFLSKPLVPDKPQSFRTKIFPWTVLSCRLLCIAMAMERCWRNPSNAFLSKPFVLYMAQSFRTKVFCRFSRFAVCFARTVFHFMFTTPRSFNDRLKEYFHFTRIIFLECRDVVVLLRSEDAFIFAVGMGRIDFWSYSVVGRVYDLIAWELKEVILALFQPFWSSVSRRSVILPSCLHVFIFFNSQS